MSEYTDSARTQMSKSIDALQANFARVRTGRANPRALDGITVDYYGAQTPITQLAGIKVPEASMLVIEPWDKSSLKSIERAIMDSDLGITPSNDGVAIRLPFPKPTEERRRELARDCNRYAEEAKVAIRNARRVANERAERDEKDGNITEDDLSREKKAIQKLTDEFTKKVDEQLKAKNAELMEI